jgi:type I restriction enzyme M protein
VSDGSLLFLMHLISKMKPVRRDGTGGSRIAIVFSGSPLFAGAAGGGESEIRRWIIENDWLEAIVALPDQLFYNTGISTYFWVLTNRKTSAQAGKVALVDARHSWMKMRKGLGDKRKYLADEQIDEVTQLYADALDGHIDDKRVKVFDREAFGYQRITVERPLRRQWELTSAALGALLHDRAWTGWLSPPKGTREGAAWVRTVEAAQQTLLDALRGLVGRTEATEAAYKKHLTQTIAATCVDVPDKVTKAVLAAAAVPDPDAPPITNRAGDPLPDADLRDNENIPLPVGWLSLNEADRQRALIEQAETYLTDEIHPYAPDAWIDHTKTKLGYEIPFTRQFHEYIPPRPLAEIDADLANAERSIQELLSGIRG